MLSTQLWWYTARSSGLVAWAVLSASVLWGLFLSTKALGRRVRPNWMLDLHRYLGGTAVVFVAIHIGSLLLDTWVHFGPTQVLVPFTSSYRTSAVAWGVVGFYLLGAVEITSLLRKRLSKRAWRAVHFAAFPLFVTATVHGLQAGTDGHTPAFQIAVSLVAAAVCGMTALRIAQATERPAPASSLSARTPITQPVPERRWTKEAA